MLPVIEVVAAIEHEPCEKKAPLTSVTLRKPEKSATTFPCVNMTPFGFPVRGKKRREPPVKPSHVRPLKLLIRRKKMSEAMGILSLYLPTPSG